MRTKRRAGNSHKAVAYLRTSTDVQDNGMEAQEAAIRAWAERAGATVVSWHRDELSGSTPVDERDGFLAALAAVKEHGAGVLVAARRDRLARDVSIAAAIERLAEEAGARVLTADGVAAEDTPEGQLMRTLLDAFAQYERAVIRGRIRAALGAKKRRGEVVGEAPFGKRRAADGVRLEEHPDEQRVMRRIRDMAKRGLAPGKIAEQLNADAVPARGKGWHRTSIVRILTTHPIAE
jgi:site-specific DNA recombinase